MTGDDAWRMVRDEREEILTFLAGLTPGQWQAASLCEGWRVRDVAVHLLVDEPFREVGWLGGVATLARLGFSVHRANEWWVQRNAARPVADVLAMWRRSIAPGPVSRLLGPANGLRAGVIHHQDMRRPLGLPREIPAGRLRAVLEAITKPSGSVNLGSHQRAAGLRLHATDIGWVHGDGPEVSGPAESLIMALAGRPAALAGLAGEGAAELAARAGAGTMVPG